MTQEVYVIIENVVPGVWELFSKTAYLSEKDAIDECLEVIDYMHKNNKPEFCAKVEKLKIK